MTTITIQRQPRPLNAHPRLLARGYRATKNALRAARNATLTQHKASLRRLTEMPLTVVATGLLDWAGFHFNSITGLIVTGVSLVVLEHMISDDETPVRR